MYNSKKVMHSQRTRPCHVVLNDIKGLLDENGIYMVPGRSRRTLTCYRCFKKFDSAESLEIHKAEHEPESEEENVYAVSDSEIEIESESDDDQVIKVDDATARTSKSPSKLVEHSIEYVRKPETPVKQVQVVEPIRLASKENQKGEPESSEKKDDAKKVPVLCNIQIRCLTCDALFTNSEVLMQHKPASEDKPCCFTCKVCNESYSKPEDYLTHIMQHNTFSTSRFGYRGGNRRKPEFRCTYCRKEFDHRFLLKQHEEEFHQDLITSNRVPGVVVLPPKPSDLVVPIVEKTKPLETVVKETIRVNPADSVLVVEQTKPIEIAVKEPIQVKPTETETNAAPTVSKPKIWVIKEALMKSPEPPVLAQEKPAAVATSGVKRSLDVLGEMAKPAKRGRPSKSAGTSLPPVLAKVAVPIKINLTCDVCLDEFSDKASFDEHMVFHNQSVTGERGEPSGSEDFTCPTCQVVCKSAAGLRRHQLCAHENKMTGFVCDKCTKIFSSRRGLNIHKNKCNGF